MFSSNCNSAPADSGAWVHFRANRVMHCGVPTSTRASTVTVTLRVVTVPVAPVWVSWMVCTPALGKATGTVCSPVPVVVWPLTVSV